MTFNSNRKAALAVTAGLVGALTLGGAATVVAPTAAFAEEGADTMSVQPTVQAKLENGRNGVAVEPKLVNGDKVVELAAGSSAYVNVSSVVDGDVNDYDFVYTVRNSSGSYVAPSILGGGSGVNQTNVSNYFDVSRTDNAATIQARTKAGMRYKLDVYAKSDTAHAQSLYTVYFEYVAPEKVYTLTNSVDGSTSFAYNGKQVPVQVTDQDGNPVSVTFYDADGDKTSEGVGDAPVWAGKYTAKTGDGAVLPFTVDKLDLAKAEYDNFMFSNTNTPTSADDFLDKVTLSSGKKLKDIAKVSESDGWNKDDGVYTVAIVPSDSPEAVASVTGSGKVTYYVADKNLSLNSVFYGQVEAGLNGTVTINGSEGQTFNASKLKVTGTDGKVYSGDALSIKYEKQTGASSYAPVSASALSAKGSYKLTVTVKPVKSATDGDLHYNDTTVYVNVTGASLDADQTLTYTKDGKVVAGTVKTVYDGSDVLKTIAYEVKDSDGKVYKAGEDYTVTVKKTVNADGTGANKVVDSIVDAGTYVITATGKTFDFAKGTETLTVVVKPVKITDLAKAELTYNGTDLEVPAAKYAVLDADDNATGDYAELPADVYSVAEVRFDKDADGKTVNKVVKSPNAAGTYTVRIGLTDKAGDNYVLSDRDFDVVVFEYSPFEDVAPEAWYAKSVNDAAKLGYVHGAGNSKLFMPSANINRADAIGILFNMAGGDSFYNDDELGYHEGTGYDTGFSDVDGNAYFAKALAWAHKYGVANGNGGKFNPSATLTREEFATFLANYAKAKGEDATSDEDALSTLKDGSDVSAWAKESANWAVANKIMGKNGTLDAHNTITRAEVAAMAVSYQPSKVKDPVTPGPDVTNPGVKPEL